MVLTFEESEWKCVEMCDIIFVSFFFKFEIILKWKAGAGEMAAEGGNRFAAKTNHLGSVPGAWHMMGGGSSCMLSSGLGMCCGACLSMHKQYI